MSKLGISLSESTCKTLAGLATAHDVSASAVVDVALVSFANLPEAERQRYLRRHSAGKRATTRSGWMAAFWDLLAEEFHEVDFAHGNVDRCMVDRTRGGFGLVFLNQNAYLPDSEDDGFIVHLFERPPIHDGGTFASQNFRFDRPTPVYQAVTKMASWIREHQALVSQNAT
jgi:hypothetical protein